MNSDTSLDVPDTRTENLPEAELVKQAQIRPQAFGPLYELYYDRILGYLYRRSLDTDVAEELTSTTFLKAIRGLPKYRHRGQFSAWIYRIATNEFNAHCRTNTNRREGNLQWPRDLDRIWFASPEINVDEDAEEKMRTFAQLHAAVESLPEIYRSVIALRYFEEMPYADVAEVLGKPAGTVKSLIHRGLRQLKRKYKTERANE